MANLNTLDTQGWWMADSSHLYIPSTPIDIAHNNLTGASSGRGEDGVMHIDWVRRDVRVVTLSYPFMTASELAYTVNLMQGKEFVLTFRDQGTTKTMNAYVGETKSQLYRRVDSEEIYANVEMQVIEL